MRRAIPYAVTEQGVAMLSSVLRSQRAIQVNIEIIRAFVRLRRILASHVHLAPKLDALEKKDDTQSSSTHPRTHDAPANQPTANVSIWISFHSTNVTTLGDTQ